MMKQIRHLRVPPWRRVVVIAHDWTAIVICLWLSFLVRFDYAIPDGYRDLFLKSLPWVFLIQAPVFYALGLYRGVWAFASLHDLFSIGRAILIGNLLCFAGVYLSGDTFTGWPRSIFLLDSVFLLLSLGGGRFVYRYTRDILFARRTQRKRVLIIGAGRTGALIAKELLSATTHSSHIVGYLDDNIKLQGSQIQGANVLGPIESIGKWIQKRRPDEVVIAIPGLKGAVVKMIFARTQNAGIACRIIPNIGDILVGRLGNNLRKVSVEDLLRRDTVTVDQAALSNFFRGKSVLITGAGGSIGSELSRQVLRYGPSRVVFFERSEFNLYRLEQTLKLELEEQIPFVIDTKFILGDVLDEKKLESIFSEYAPKIVIHAAAYKHVPLIEENPGEGLKNNALGTYRVTNQCAKSGVETLVMVSTDKSVRPTSIMGATKRVAEMIVSRIGMESKLRTLAVRFGNVLDSDGSVLPLFRSQIARGGPVTVTHPEMTRYFMTIPEASSLVLQAALLGKGGEVFLLDMGEPVKIAQLAEDLISLSGLRPHKDIEIQFTGLRRGEKLYEELLVDTKNARQTTHPKIWMSQEDLAGALPEGWKNAIERLEDGLTSEEARKMIQAWVQDYKPNATENESSPSTPDEFDPTKPIVKSKLTH